MKGKVIFLLVLVLIAVMGLGLRAYAASDTVYVTGTANAKITMSIDDTTIPFPASDPGVLTSGPNPFTVNIKSNKAYNYVVTAPANWTGGSTPPISRMEFNRTGWTAFAGGSNDASASAVKTSGTDWTYDLRLTWDYTDDPVGYSADLVPTALQNP